MIAPRYAPAIETAIRANPKVYVMDAGFMDVFSFLPAGKRIESMVARHFYFENLSYFHNKWEVDFILRRDHTIIPIEVKYREKVRIEQLAGLKAFYKKTPFDRAIVITKNFKKPVDNITFTPAHLFLALV